MQYLKLLLGSSMTILLLTACSAIDDGPNYTTYSGNTSQASIDASKASTFTKATSDATLQGIDSENITLPFAAKSSRKLMAAQKTATIMQMQAPVQGFCNTGSVDVSGNEASATITYANCTLTDITDTITINGTATYTSSNAGANFSVTFRNFTIKFNDEPTETIENMTLACTNSGTTCTVTSDFTGFDGKVYRVSNFSVSGVTPYAITGRIYHPTHGYVDIVGSVTYGTCGMVERPVTGSIAFTGSNGTAAITFIDCNSFSININGTITTGTW